MRISSGFRNLKNQIVSRPWLHQALLKAINLPVLGDAYDFVYLRVARPKIYGPVRHLVIEPNNICNLKCIMCPYPDMERPKETMPLDLFCSIVDQAQELGCRDVSLEQYNEPFTDKLLFDRIRHIRSRGLYCYFYSNGTLLSHNDHIAKTLATPPNAIRFSVDGFSAEVYEKIRVNAHRDEVYRGIEALFDERNRRGLTEPRIEIFFTLTEQNQHELAAFQEYWKTRSDYISINAVDSRKDGGFVQLDFAKLKAYPCFNQANLIVLSSGRIAMCCVDVNGQQEIGDLKKQSLREVLASRPFRALLDSHFNRSGHPKFCEGCSKLKIDSALNWWF